MARVPLVSGAYQGRSLIASAQRCVNLFPEENPDPQAPVPITHYPTPGLTHFGQAPVIAGFRALYTATNGVLFGVAASALYKIDSGGLFTKLGDVADRITPVSMADNGLALVIVDGTATGYVVDLATLAFGTIADPNFMGANRVVCIDTYFVFNKPGTAQFYISLSEATYAMMTSTTAGTAFDSLDVAAKAGSADPIVAIAAVRGQLWLVGSLTTEIWYNSGAADFTFERQPGAFIEHGCIAPFSVAKQDVALFWLSQDREGQGIIVKGSGYGVERISTHAIEADILTYAQVNDAIGFCYQQEGHAFYAITFPTADKTWAYELKTGQWHELAWTDLNGVLHRHRAGACAAAYGKNLIGDWQSGELYLLDPDAFTDAGQPITRIRTFPHMIRDARRVTYTRFIIDMQTGTSPLTSGPGNLISLRWSDTRGATWSNPVTQDIGAAGDYGAFLTFNRLGMARDRVFEISWSAPLRTALNGAFVEATVHAS